MEFGTIRRQVYNPSASSSETPDASSVEETPKLVGRGADTDGIDFDVNVRVAENRPVLVT